MRAYKSKVEKTKFGEIGELPSNFPTGYCVSVQSVYYSSKNPSEVLTLLDAQGDSFMRSLPGQGTDTGTPNPYVLDTPVTVQLPIKYVDTGDENAVIVWGEAYRVEQSLESSF